MRVGERNIELDNRFNVLFTKARGEFVEVKKVCRRKRYGWI